MKKILLSFAACLICLFSFGQSKYCDIELTMADSLYVVPFGDTDYVFINLKNLGPDSITGGDTLYYMLEGYPFNFVLYDEVIAPGESLHIEILENWTEPGTFGTDTFVQCLYMLPSNNYTDTVALNDTSCYTEILFGDTSNLGINNHLLSENIRVYPNPVSGNYFYVNISKPSPHAAMSLVNVLGQRLRVRETDLGAGLHQLDVSGLPNGIYSLIYTDGQRQLQSKLVISR